MAPLGPERFEEQQEKFANDERLNDIYRQGLGPAAVHGFYMYTWASHGMEKVNANELTITRSHAHLPP